MQILRNYLFLLAILFAASIVQAADKDLLEPEQAFRFSARVLDEKNIELRYQIADGYYLYRERFAFAAESGVKLGVAQIPQGKVKKDEFFGEVQTHRGELRIVLPVEAVVDGKAGLTVTSQGCADVGVCYVPMDSKAQLAMVTGAGATGFPVAQQGGNDALAQIMRQAQSGAAPAMPAPQPVAEDSRIAALFQGNVLLLIASFFGFGLLLSLTPCVLPMIPILSGIIVGRGQAVTRAQGFALSVAYVLGMAVTYAAAGVAAGLSGAMLSAALQNPWVLGAFAAVFVLLAFAMFGFYELQLPAALQTRLAEASGRLSGGQYSGVFVMGALSALIVGPCVAAPLAGALLYISQSRDGVLGGAALFAMALGMGVPLLAVGASAGALLPKAGPWMDGVKHFFGVLLLAVAIYLVSPVVPIAAQMLAWGALLIISAVNLRVIDPLPVGATGVARLGKGIGVVALLAGTAYLAGALSGSTDLLKPLQGLVGADHATRQSGEQKATHASLFQRVATGAELDAAIQAARGKPVLLDFYADWCVSCKEMERFTFTDERVKKRYAGMLMLQVDVTANTAEHQALLKRFRLFGPPGIIFFDKAGKEIMGLRVIGFQAAEKFAGVLDEVIAF